MTETWPWTFSKDDPAGPELEDRLQEVLDAIGQKFPIGAGDIANSVLRLAATGTSRSIAFGVVTATYAALTAGTDGVATVAHSLGAAPIVVVVAPTTGGTFFNNVYLVGTSNYTSTTFDVTVHNGSAINLSGGTNKVAYAAIG